MAQVAVSTASARARARFLAEEVRRGSIESRRAVAEARMRRAQLRRRPRPWVVAGLYSLRTSPAAELHDWSGPVSRAVMFERATAARAEAACLRRDAIVLRGAVGWEMRRLWRAQRRVSEEATALVWHDGPDDLDDILV